MSLSFSVLLFFDSQKAFASGISEQKLIELANQERSNHGLPILVLDPLLYFAAQRKAEDMISHHYFDHYRPNGQSPWVFMIKAGYHYLYAGENLAMDFRSSEGIHRAWMASGSHRENILNPNYENIAIAVVKGEIDNHQTTLVVEMFGKKDTTILDKINALTIKITSYILGYNLPKL